MADAPGNPISCEILISGAGPAGLTLALALGSGGFETLVVDARPLAAEGGARGGRGGGAGRVYLVAAGCWRMFDALGLGERLRPEAEPVYQVAASSGGGGGISFEGGDDRIGDALGYVVECEVLERVLGEAVLRVGQVSVRAPDRLSDIDVQAGRVAGALESGAAVEARLLVGCDGARSAVRDAAGIAFEGWDYGYRALSTVMIPSTPHDGVARQEFLPGGPIAALPMTGGRVNVVWSVKACVAETLLEMSDAAFEAELARQAEGFLPGAELAGPRAAFALSNRIASRFHGERVALAGDSAHVVHPLAGQGLNLGLKDVAALVDVIGEADRVGLDIGSESALAPYTQWRRPDIVATASAMEGFHRFFTASGLVRGVAGAAMGAAGLIPGARKVFAMEAAGVLGETPRLMRRLEEPAA